MSDAIATETTAASDIEQPGEPRPAEEPAAPAAEAQPMDQSAVPQASAPEQPQANATTEPSVAKKESVSLANLCHP